MENHFNKNYRMSNAANGKTMENLRNRVDVRPVNNIIDYLKWPSKSSYVVQKIFQNNVVAIHRIKTILMLNKAAYVGKGIAAQISLRGPNKIRDFFK